MNQTLKSPIYTPTFEITASPQFTAWLAQQNLSLAFTTYQTNRLFLIGCQANGRLKFHERLFDKPMGLYADGERLYMSTRYQLWHFENLLEPGEKYGECDRLYIPRTSYTTGNVNVHDLALGNTQLENTQLDNTQLENTQNIIFVNTDFSCVATLHPNYSFVPLWQPPFIDKLVAEDRCHLNGLAMIEGKPAYVTACSTTNTPAGWRNHRRDGGVVIDIEQNEIIATGLSMPHSPRWYKGKLWLLNSGTGELGYIDDGRFVPITFCPGFVRGLAFWGDFAIVGLSKLRSSSFTGLALEDRLLSQGNTAHCGLMAIDLTTGQIVHWLHIGRTIEELFDIVVLPNVRQPEVLGLQGDDVQRLVRFPNSGGIVTTKPTLKRPSIGQTTPVAAQASQMQREELAVKYQRVYHLNPSNVLAYDALIYPNLHQRWQNQPPKGELLGISAAVEGSLVGFAIAAAKLNAESLNNQTAEIISLMVLPNYRQQGIGTKILFYLQQELTQQGIEKLTLSYESNSLTQIALEPILKKLQWQPPQTNSTNGELSHRVKWIRPRVEIPQLSVSEKPAVEYRRLEKLTVEHSILYNNLTFPKIQTRWSRQRPKGQLVGILAEVSGEQVGLTIAEVFQTRSHRVLQAEVISLLVLPEYRHQGIATGLMNHLETALRTLGCTQVKVVYKSTPITTSALEHILKRQNWQLPKINFLLAKTTIEKLSQAPWLRKYPLSKKFTVFPWNELTDADKQQIQTLDYPASLSPFSNTPGEPLNSLGLRYNTQLVGWMVTHRVAIDAIRYSTMFVDKRFQRLARGVSLMSESILRQADSSVPYCLCAVAEDNPAMQQFVDRHLQPYLTEVTDSRVCIKHLVC